MTLDGAFAIAAPRDHVWKAIRDPAFVAACVPRWSGVEVLSRMCNRAKIAVSLGPILARFDLLIEITGETPHEQVCIETGGADGSRASMLKAVSVLSLKDVSGTQTGVRHNPDVSITSRFGKFGLGTMRQRPDQLATGFVSKFTGALQTADVS